MAAWLVAPSAGGDGRLQLQLLTGAWNVSGDWPTPRESLVSGAPIPPPIRVSLQFLANQGLPKKQGHDDKSHPYEYGVFCCAGACQYGQHVCTRKKQVYHYVQEIAHFRC
jgi:hypothetical protein